MMGGYQVQVLQTWHMNPCPLPGLTGRRLICHCLHLSSLATSDFHSVAENQELVGFQAVKINVTHSVCVEELTVCRETRSPQTAEGDSVPNSVSALQPISLGLTLHIKLWEP